MFSCVVEQKSFLFNSISPSRIMTAFSLRFIINDKGSFIEHSDVSLDEILKVQPNFIKSYCLYGFISG